MLIIKSKTIITFLSITSILFIFLFSIIDNNNIIITVQSSIENTTTPNTNNSNQSVPNSNFTTAIQWKKFVNETIGISLEYPSNWEQNQILEDQIEPKDKAFPKQEFPMKESPSGTYFRFSVREALPFEDNLEILTRMQAAMLLDFSSEYSKYEIIDKPNTKEYTIDGEKAGAFSYRVTVDYTHEGSCFSLDPFIQLEVEKINVIHEGKFYEFQFSFDHCFFVFTTNEFNILYINKIKDHIFNSIRWLN